MTILLGLCAAAGAANAAEIHLLSTGGVKEALAELLPAFERSSGHAVRVTWSSTVKIAGQIASGDAFDLVIVGAPEIDRFIAEGKLAAGTRVDLVRSGIGVAVKAGAPKPDISSAERVKAALIAAKSIAYSTGPSGAHIRALFDRFGIADQMLPKARQTVPGRRVGDYLSSGEAELGFQQVSELIHEHGIDFLGPLPPDIQNFTVFSSGVIASSKERAAAQALQGYLASPTADAVIKKNGLEPARATQ